MLRTLLAFVAFCSLLAAVHARQPDVPRPATAPADLTALDLADLARSARAIPQAGLLPKGGVWANRFKITATTHRRHQVAVANDIARHADQGAAVWTISSKRGAQVVRTTFANTVNATAGGTPACHSC